MKTQCPDCKQSYEYSEQDAGRYIACQRCGYSFHLPEPIPSEQPNNKTSPPNATNISSKTLFGINAFNRLRMGGGIAIAGSATIIALIVFLLFGWLLKDFLAFDANRTEMQQQLISLRSQTAKQEVMLNQQQPLVTELQILSEKVQALKKELQNLETDRAEVVILAGRKEVLEENLRSLSSQQKIARAGIVANQEEAGKEEGRLSKVKAELSERKAELASQQAQHDEYVALLAKLTTIRQEYQKNMEAWKATNEELIKVREMLTKAKVEGESLATMKKTLSAEVPDLELIVTRLRSQIITAQKGLAETKAAQEIAKQQLETEASKVNELNTILKTKKNNLAQLEMETEKASLKKAAAQAAVVVLKEEADALTKSKDNLKRERERESLQLSIIEQNKLSMENQIQNLQREIAKLDAQIKGQKTTAEQINKESAKIEVKNDALLVQQAILENSINEKRAEEKKIRDFIEEKRIIKGL